MKIIGFYNINKHLTIGQKRKWKKKRKKKKSEKFNNTKAASIPQP